MARPKRQPIRDDTFDDPLRDYSEPTYDDTIQRAVCESPITDMKHKPFTAVEADTPIEQVLRKMVKLTIACVVVTRNDKLVGIFSERDVLDKVADQYENVKNEPISSVMTSEPVAVRTTDTPAKALATMAVGGFRHVPILSVEEKVVGIVGPRRVNNYLFTNISDV